MPRKRPRQLPRLAGLWKTRCRRPSSRPASRGGAGTAAFSGLQPGRSVPVRHTFPYLPSIYSKGSTRMLQQGVGRLCFKSSRYTALSFLPSLANKMTLHWHLRASIDVCIGSIDNVSARVPCITQLIRCSHTASSESHEPPEPQEHDGMAYPCNPYIEARESKANKEDVASEASAEANAG